ncbi:16S rRNA (uracil(1498)-N(3))-methyltransferase [Oceanibacterium hippocampi]|uniref:Ribosomal RNA small subunit methyltransferase E n=1 Tax=Oceanibacterium hippocampi TaxID=745714 RepID=A0A1Y5S5W0_9PROT|nr:16S rRNA (uracil(1498)-N(3))-methyltransferase [Oceanibacterium hippocampi]SLN33188.1 Ribosomal RNA small subunit methyltransferase E [Oceanibacterium hippocampi]
MARSNSVRLYVGDELTPGRALALDREAAHYLGNVMRRTAGDPVLLFNGRDGEWRAEIGEVGRKAVTLQVREQTRPQSVPADLWLLFAAVKRGPTDLIVQKATELGVSEIHIVTTERSQSERLRPERLHVIAREAAEQSRRLDLPGITPPEKLADLLDRWPAERALIFCDEGGTAPAALDGMAAAARKDSPAAVLIGPEGGFSEAERARIAAHPAALSVSLGPLILRAETAAIAALVLWQAARGDWRA